MRLLFLNFDKTISESVSSLINKLNGAILSSVSDTDFKEM